jgi:hypothetical protein
MTAKLCIYCTGSSRFIRGQKIPEIRAILSKNFSRLPLRSLRPLREAPSIH